MTLKIRFSGESDQRPESSGVTLAAQDKCYLYSIGDFLFWLLLLVQCCSFKYYRIILWSANLATPPPPTWNNNVYSFPYPGRVLSSSWPRRVSFLPPGFPPLPGTPPPPQSSWNRDSFFLFYFHPKRLETYFVSVMFRFTIWNCKTLCCSSGTETNVES
jgi:hypothetical protein